jgi:tetratricopeptide (TPR) repeat protein
MSSSHAQPIPKAPAERTLIVAIIVLSLVAILQLAAVGIALVPRVDFEKLGHSLAPRPAAPAEVSEAPVNAEEQSATARALVAEAREFREKGNFQGALEAVTEADRALPNKPGILIQMASDYNQLGRQAEMLAVLNKIVALPPSSDPADAPYRVQAQTALAQLGGGAPAPATASQTSATAAAAAKDPANMRDDVGIPIGSVMGIVDVKLLDGEPGQKNLRVSTKGASNQKVDPLKFQATVDFYEQDDQSQIVHNDSPRPNEWLSGPSIDWADASPEIFQVKYRLPLRDRGDLPPLQYYGYVVAIYYNGELQDQRADPPALLNQYAPALHKDLSPE